VAEEVSAVETRPASGRSELSIADFEAAGLDARLEALESTIENAENESSANVAVLSEPLAGKRSLIQHAVNMLENPLHVSFDRVPEDDSLPAIDGSQPLVVENCQYLFERSIGGFELLDTFLERLALSEPLVVTSWNSFAWDYLDAITEVEESFTETIRLPSLSGGQISDLLDAREDVSQPGFVTTAEYGRFKTIDVDHYSLRLFGDRAVDIPIPRPNTEWVSSWFVDDTDESIESVVYEKISRVASGNPGVALALWRESISDGEVAPADIREPDADHGIDATQAHLLWVILCKGSITRNTLDERFEEVSVDKELQTLADRGLVVTEGPTVRIPPAPMSEAIAELERRRMLW
jgi:hypothetical protein